MTMIIVTTTTIIIIIHFYCSIVILINRRYSECKPQETKGLFWTSGCQSAVMFMIFSRLIAIIFVSYLMFWLIHFDCFLFQMIGCSLIAIGIWAVTEKGSVSNINQLTNSVFDPVSLLLVAGCVIFIIGFFGCVGALRENTILLILVTFINSFCCVFLLWLLWEMMS